MCTAPPALRKAMEDGSDRTSLRNLLYGIENSTLAHSDVAVETAGSGARSCTKVLKCIEGQFNKAFLMTMDNGVEVLAKIPNPNVGSAFYTTASEVATRNFVREVLNFPVPRIHAYSLDPLNPVGIEYIIEEKAAGKPLGNLWRKWPRESQLGLVAELVDLEAKLASVSFRSHGCIYYKADLETKGVRTHSLEATYKLMGNALKEVDSSIMAKFALGPLTEAVLWEGERATMPLDRGPWPSAVDYMMALGMNEIRWTKTCAVPQMNYHRPVDTPELPDEYLSLLRRYLVLVPYLPPIFPENLHSKTLFHQDLHLDNIFVDPDTKKINNIIDWQMTPASEMFLQHKIPAMLPPLGGYESIPETKSQSSGIGTGSGENDDILKHYQNLTRIKNPLRWAAINHPHKYILQPVSLISGAWSRNDMFSFRHALITIAAHWKDICPNSTSCPISFTEQELALHNEEMELLEELGTVLHLLQDQNLISVGGRVLREDYEGALAVNIQVKKWFLDMAEDEQQKILYERIWPY
ncbi:Altered inheritance of mitochondria protein, mitochondrial [Lachnellula occidentalis]|uniref:Altered inheritance of mitochondria protein 9, mitochondrial n=1 Tax=Lachnellula occidentalis TaxID=215460 RepID=A0A8H8RXF0_9HELO|nr:Altered inheritance of mitochondria protein, mitochondrial [Lachnellula occidentalis]